MNYMEGRFFFSQVHLHVLHVPPVKILPHNPVNLVNPVKIQSQQGGPKQNRFPFR